MIIVQNSQLRPETGSLNQKTTQHWIRSFDENFIGNKFIIVFIVGTTYGTNANMLPAGILRFSYFILGSNFFIHKVAKY
jgi:hypothetical protein